MTVLLSFVTAAQRSTCNHGPVVCDGSLAAALLHALARVCTCRRAALFHVTIGAASSAMPLGEDVLRPPFAVCAVDASGHYLINPLLRASQ